VGATAETASKEEAANRAILAVMAATVERYMYRVLGNYRKNWTLSRRRGRVDSAGTEGLVDLEGLAARGEVAVSTVQAEPQVDPE
jgi:hypothetical protein